MANFSQLAKTVRRRLAGEDAAPAVSVLPASRLAGPMPWVIAIMAALTVLATGAALALANFTGQARAGLEGGVTVQIVDADPATRDAQSRRAVAALRAQPGVAEVRAVPAADVADLVEPWLGDTAGSGELVLPALIDVRLEGATDAGQLAALRAALATTAPGARVEAQAGWLRPVFGAVSALRWLALVLILLLTLASAATVWLAARNALDANRGTIEIIHHLGAGDGQIARIFQRAVLGDALIGGLLGLIVGAGGLVIIGDRLAALQSGLVGSGALGPMDWLLVALVPVIMAAVAMATARRTVLARLGRML